MRTLLCGGLLVAACASDDGAAPTISAMTYAPMTVARGQTSTISGTVMFDDADGDLAQLGMEVTLPDQSTQQLPLTDVQNVGDMTSGTLTFALTVVPPTAGAYAFALWVTDLDGHDSNRLTGTITVQ